MAARTTVKSGLASDSTVWNGETPLADNDSITITAGHTLTWDLDWSSQPNGVAGFVISGHATTPATLTCPTTEGNYVLKIKANTSIYGTNFPQKGRLYIGTSPEEPLPDVARFTIDLQTVSTTTASVNAQYIDVKCYCARPAHTDVQLTSQAIVGATVLNVDTDVTGDRWKVGDWVAVTRHDPNNSANSEMRKITEITATTISITPAITVLKPQYSRVVLCNRNVNMMFYTTSNAYCFQLMTYGYWDGAICNPNDVVLGSARGYPGNVNYSTWKGVIAGSYYGIIAATGCEIDVVITHTYLGFYTIPGCRIASSTKMIGLLYAFYFEGTESAGLVTHCSYAFYAQGWIVGPDTVITGNYRGFFRGDYIIHKGAIIGGQDSLTRNGGGDFYPGYTTLSRIYGNVLRSPMQVVNYTTTVQLYKHYTGVLMYDVADSTTGTPMLGRIASWTNGGYAKSIEWASVTGSVQTGCPITPDYLHQFVYQAALNPNWFETPMNGNYVAIHVKLDQVGMTDRPRFSICDPNYEFLNPNGILAEFQAEDTTSWQSAFLTLPQSRPTAVLRVVGYNASGTMHCYWEFKNFALQMIVSS